MAGLGVRLNRIFEKNTLVFDLIGFGYSILVTIAPMLVVILNIVLMGKVLGLSNEGYAGRELMSSTILYMFIFSLLTMSPFNAVLSRYMSDVIYEDRYEDILPCFYVGLLFNTALSCLLGIPFCIYEYIVGRVDVIYVLTGFSGYMALVLVFCAMSVLTICKDYKKISLFYFIGMVVAFLCSLLFAWVCNMDVTYSILLAMVIGFLVTAALEIGIVKQYFKTNSGRYRAVFVYFKRYWMLVVTNFFYTLGLFVHNFVFWNTHLKMVVVNTFVSAPPYDMATCIAMFTNISATVIFMSRVEMYFGEKYRGYSEAVIGGRGIDIENAKRRMFRQLAAELMNLTRIQFIVSVIIFLLCIVILPQYGFSGLVMQIYPCLAAGYFILFIMYSTIIFLYYFNDSFGAMLSATFFVFGVFGGSVFASHLTAKWYGLGVIIGALLGWTVAYIRIRWVERNMDVHTFCHGNLIKYAKGTPESAKVFDRNEKPVEDTKEARKRAARRAAARKRTEKRKAAKKKAAKKQAAKARAAAKKDSAKKRDMKKKETKKKETKV